MTRERTRTDRKISSRWLEKFLVRRKFAVFAGVMQGHVGVRSSVHGINFATGIGMRVDVDAGGALVEFGEVEDLMDGFFALDGAGVVVVHVVGAAGTEIAGALSAVLIFDAEILNAEFTDGNGHPAVLSTMIVDAADLADFPPDGHDFEEIALEDEISRVVALGVEEIGLKRVEAQLVLLEILFDFRESEILAMNCGKAFHPFVDGHLRHRGPPSECY